MMKSLKQNQYHKKNLVLVLLVISIVITICSLVDLMFPVTEATKLRNSFIAYSGEINDVAWTPEEVPKTYLEEKIIPDQFKNISNDILGSKINQEENFFRALKIAQHLMKGPGRGKGIQTDTFNAYQKIMTEGGGYCADYSQVFNGIAISSEIPVREWGMTFDGFGGDGHTFNEIYDNSLKKWIMIDSFYSLYIKNIKTNEPLSVMEFRKYLTTGEEGYDYEIVPIVSGKFAFNSNAHAVKYYKKGINQLYLWWGNNVFSYDSNNIVRILGPISRSLEQTSAIIMGIHPRILIISTTENEDEINSLNYIRNKFIALIIILLAQTVLIIVTLILGRKLTRRRSSMHNSSVYRKGIQ